jgi:putative aldouronate transport system permease protein
LSKRRPALRRRIWRNYELYLFLLPTLLYFLIFHYVPMYGVQIAFKEFVAVKGITGSPWVGFDQFERFFRSYQFGTLLRNTLGIALYQLLVGFPVPVILALMIHQLRSARFKRLVQTVAYAPHFISTVVMVGMLYLFLSERNGLINRLLRVVGLDSVFFLGDPAWFKSVYVWSGIWQNAGWGTIIYLAALAGVSRELHEAAIADGASRLRRIWHIDLPGIRPTIVIMLILDVGHFMNIGFEKVFLMQNSLNLQSSEIISTYVYKVGLLSTQYSYSAAIGLFNNVINFILLLAVNQLARRMRQTALW